MRQRRTMRQELSRPNMLFIEHFLAKMKLTNNPAICHHARGAQAPGARGRHGGNDDQRRLHRLHRLWRSGASLSRWLAHQSGLQGAHLRLRHQDRFARHASAGGEAGGLRGGRCDWRVDRGRSGRGGRGGVLRCHRRSGAPGGARGSPRPQERRVLFRLRTRARPRPRSAPRKLSKPSTGAMSTSR